jgi:hypothetical protein
MDYCAALVVSTPKPPRPEDRVRHETNGKKVMAGSYLSILVDTHTRMGRGGIPALLENPFSGGFMLRLHLRKVPAHAASLGLLPLQEVSYKRVKKHWNPCQASPHPAEGNPCGGFMLRFAGCCTSTFPRTRRFHATFTPSQSSDVREKAPSRATSSAFAKFQQGC